MGEEFVDVGGPRRTWIRLVNREMKAKYFNNGLRQYLSQDYFYVGIMIAGAPGLTEVVAYFKCFIHSSKMTRSLRNGRSSTVAPRYNDHPVITNNI